VKRLALSSPALLGATGYLAISLISADVLIVPITHAPMIDPRAVSAEADALVDAHGRRPEPCALVSTRSAADAIWWSWFTGCGVPGTNGPRSDMTCTPQG